jgi:transposase
MADERPAPDDPIYDLLLELEDLEALREEMLERDVRTAAELAALPPEEAPPALAALRARNIDSLAALDQGIAALHRQLDALEGSST